MTIVICYPCSCLNLIHSVNGHNDLASVVRGAQYFQHPPVLPLLCSEIDGDQTNTPIIFEDVYKDESQGGKVHSISSGISGILNNILAYRNFQFLVLKLGQFSSKEVSLVSLARPE